jgi:hypothetical protein
MRVWCSQSWIDYLNADGVPGKMFYIELAGGGNQELLITGSRVFDMGTNYGKPVSNPLWQPQGTRTDYNPPYPFHINQPGGVYNDSCIYPGSINTCWAWPANQWVTILIHVIPGEHNGDATAPSFSDMYGTTGKKNTGIQVWTDWNHQTQQRQSSYIKIWEKLDYAWSYDSTVPAYGNQKGFNIVTFSSYKNNHNAPVAWSYRLGQIIFSTQPIACPQA